MELIAFNQTERLLIYTEPGRLSGLQYTKLTSSEARIKWNRLSCRQYNGIAVGYTYKLSRRVQHSQAAVDVMYGIVNVTTLYFNDLVPFTNYTLSVQFANHLHQGPRSMLDFTTFEDGKHICSFSQVYLQEFSESVSLFDAQKLHVHTFFS